MIGVQIAQHTADLAQKGQYTPSLLAAHMNQRLMSRQMYVISIMSSLLNYAFPKSAAHHGLERLFLSC